MAKALSFNKTGYDSFIDFLKAYAIIFVVISHSFPLGLWKYCFFQVWADMQVPMFILIQVFHAYKKGFAPTINYPSLLKRIVIPFIIIQGVIISSQLLFSVECAHNILTNSIIRGVRPWFLLFLDIHSSGLYSSVDMAFSEKTNT